MGLAKHVLGDKPIEDDDPRLGFLDLVRGAVFREEQDGTYIELDILKRLTRAKYDARRSRRVKHG